jgi:hypothetical protein
VRQLTVVSPSFAVDCLETLEEVAMEYRDRFLDEWRRGAALGARIERWGRSRPGARRYCKHCPEWLAYPEAGYCLQAAGYCLENWPCAGRTPQC